jgi:radical SAM protein with 4Fe4S-binding SPASM domain
MNEERFVLRDEPFGYTLFDKQKMRHKFLARGSLPEELCFDDIRVNSYEKLDADLNGALDDIIFSPIRMYFELTSACNLRCKTCFNQSGKPKPDELTTEEVKKTLKGFRNDNVFDVRFSGGELTARSDWFELLKYAKDLGFSVSFNTNGVYRNHEDTVEKIVSLNADQVAISIDGGKDFHNYIRSNSTFEKAVKTLKDLHKKGTHLRINTVLTRGSGNDLEEILELASQYVEEINFFYMRTAGRALDILDQVMTYDELLAFDEKIEPYKAKYPHVNILHGAKVLAINSIDKIKKNNVGLKMGGPDGFTRFNILPNGSIWPGGYTPHLRPEFYLGNIKDEGYTLLNIWRNSPELKRFREISLKLQEDCYECPEKGVKCVGASMEMEFYRQLDSANTNPYCKY